MLISNMAPGQVAIFTGAKGINVVSTSACASALHAIGSAYDQLVLGRADAILTGGAESTITEMGISGFTAMKALCTAHQDEPEKASRPFDAGRSGFIMGEGAGMLMLETLEHALARARKSTRKSWASALPTTPITWWLPWKPRGHGREHAQCSGDAGLSPDAIDHVSAHGTSTHANDAAETKAMHEVFGDHAKDLAITA